ncbi:hypothetical protein CAL29_07505 [Bordetella genomosp. 10]|uniref:ABC transporter substrate-binding protein n=1 Tax=Bordetella genomosp. 10 TaxID=1416804 RepID=A0A261SPE9_9BORD|nr:tripartite tricarboxylate transporter substrate binding protein [Bordetella genomosp. 10]OZI38173.1 hypothetical protein CAL29_07505 [Bordetella genomosp. 10]
MEGKFPCAVLAALLAGAAVCAPRAGLAQDASGYPDRAVHMLVPYTAGGAADVLARALSAELAKRWNQAVIVDNRPGADGAIAVDYLARNAADGYTLLYGPNAIYSIYPQVHKKAKYNARKDLVPVAMVGLSPLVLTVPSSSPVHSIPELIAYAKGHPGQVSFGSPGASSLHRMAGEQFDLDAGVKMVHVPYKGTSQAAADLAGGQIDLLYAVPQSVEPLVKAGKARNLAVTTAQRFPLMKDTPSVGETIKGWPGYATFQGVFVAKGTPAAITGKIEAAVAAIMAQPRFQSQLADLGFSSEFLGSDAFKARLEQDYEAVGKIVTKVGITED